VSACSASTETLATATSVHITRAVAGAATSTGVFCRGAQSARYLLYRQTRQLADMTWGFGELASSGSVFRAIPGRGLRER